MFGFGIFHNQTFKTNSHFGENIILAIHQLPGVVEVAIALNSVGLKKAVD